jgi:radical SAM protein with 4Fe4S-binding SPASM domain
MIALLEQLDIVLWSVFFLVPTGRGSAIDLISAKEFEQVFEKLYETSRRVPFDIKSTEAQHYRRFLLQRQTEEKRKGNGHSLPSTRGLGTPDGIGRAPRGINDGKGFVFISHLGEVFPSGFLPVSAGNVRNQSLADLYRHSPLFVALRDSSNLKGKCGICEFREVCGGSRARAYALTGDPFAEEPCCIWQPKVRVSVADGDKDPVEHTRVSDLERLQIALQPCKDAQFAAGFGELAAVRTAPGRTEGRPEKLLHRHTE